MNDERLDSELLRLFAAAPTPLDVEGTFVAATIARLARVRRAQLIRRLAGTVLIMLAGAIIAPSIAQLTLSAMDWLVDQLPQTGVALVSPLGCVCAALLAWRIARRQFN